ncbi:C2H2-type zinc finger protein [Candidatus Nitrosocosmicus arcticus]|uniref:C2H2-type domain-containing protein n=1 Tax=Candidatus Nitrosocosmicus arcticus TaxID=2035267 RepID=A0A557SUU0_9ARCH|nr:C2H2-type zinc finger protein [Candidatus Nitrosocosmicus arcticus]TVP40366.1 hypothetical protein NARC_80094 [Candidatus Nitrosocosmicus arcticus]
MLENSYQCDTCDKKFSRRSNAKRHIKVVHEGRARAFNKITGKSTVEVLQHPDKSRTGSLPLGMDAGKHIDLLSSDMEEELLSEILEKIRKPFEELESLVADQSEIPKALYLSRQITASFLSSDPVKILQELVNFIRIFKLKIKLVNYISKSDNIDSKKAESFFIETFKTGKYYMNRIKSRTNTV